MILEPGQQIERYVVEGILGEGGMASVYRVRHQALGSVYALKVLSVPSRIIRNRMLQEGRIQATIRAANVVQVVDILEVGGMMGLLMEYIKGPSLAEFLKVERLPLNDALAIFGGILAGVEVAHSKGMIHRDLKPANILLHMADDGMWPKVTDFGIAKGGESADPVDVTRPGSTMGTPAYMAPEQIQDASKVDLRADMWSLGCLLYELVCHQRCFAGDSALDVLNGVVRGEFQAPQELVPDLPGHVLEALARTLVRDPNDRVPDCKSLAAILGQTDSVESVSEVLETHLSRSSETTHRALSLAYKTPPPIQPRMATPTETAPVAPAAEGAWGQPTPMTATATDFQFTPEVDLAPAFDAPSLSAPVRPEIVRRASVHDLDDGIERLSTEEVEMFRTELGGVTQRTPLDTIAYTGPADFLGIPVSVAALLSLVACSLLGVSIHYVRAVRGLESQQMGAFVAAAEERDEGDTGFGAIPPLKTGDAAADAARAAGKAKARAGNGHRKRAKARLANPSVNPETDPGLQPPPPPPAGVLDAKTGLPSTRAPDLHLSRKYWGRVRLEGDARRIELRADDKPYFIAGKVPPGEYDVVAWFSPNKPQNAGRIRVKRETTIRLRCSVIWQRCEVQD